MFNKQIFIILLAFSGINTLSAMQPQTPQRLALFCDPCEDEHPTKNTPKTVTLKFAQTIHQKACASIVSQSILDAFITLKIANQTATLQISDDSEVTSIVFFNPLEWDIYAIKQHSYFLLAPKLKSIALHEQPATLIQLDNLIAFLPPQNKSLLETLQELSAFVRKHSHYPTSYLQTTLPSLFITAQTKAQHKPENTMPTTQTNLEEENNVRITMTPWNITLMGHGTINIKIAGLLIKEFTATLRFFNDSLNTQVMLINTCYGAGNNQRYMETYKLTLNYKLILTGTTQAPTKTMFYAKKTDPSVNFKSFFETLEQNKTPNRLMLSAQYLTVLDNWFIKLNGLSCFPQLLTPNTGWQPLCDAIEGISVITKAKLITAAQKNGCYQLGNLAAIIEPKCITTPFYIAPIDVTGAAPEWTNQWNHLQVRDVKNSESCYYPSFISFNSNYHIFKDIIILNQKNEFGGILHFLRDSFLNIQENTKQTQWFISELYGHNDITPTLTTSNQKTTITLSPNKESGNTSCLDRSLKNLPHIKLRDVCICAYAKTFDPKTGITRITSSDEKAIWTIMLMFKCNNNSYRMIHKNVDIMKGNESLWHFEPISLEQYNQQLNRLYPSFVDAVHSFKNKTESEFLFRQKLSKTLTTPKKKEGFISRSLNTVSNYFK